MALDAASNAARGIRRDGNADPGHGVIVELEHPRRGAYPMPANPVRLSDSPTRLTRAPLLGEHNAEIYGALLGYGSAELDALRKDGVI